ncbi:MAG: hypothetical protein A2X86_12535 [Bdellovibrionales bacterium GWA2_49_15]|nr:MAG: hypothetical protein A2X86_12535 [Bdellovibrionales bacterium GWA2_49_15]HAZ14679.1 hypothetical protein [Bdellovibrionales bacterium]
MLTVLLLASPAWSQSAKGKVFNPDMSANFLGLFQRGTALTDDRTEVPHNGFSLQEAELQFTSDVDAYFKAVALLGIAQEAGTTEYGIDPEEVYLETISLPNVAIKAGQFKMAVGKHNLLHSHAYPFLDAPLIHQELLGDEGLTETGVSAAVLFPFSWFSELTLQALSLSNENLFASPSSSQTGSLAHLKNLWDLTENLTLELGLSGVTGKNHFDKTSTVLAGDLTFKWRPAEGGKYQAFIWSSEFLDGNRKGLTDEVTGDPAEHLGGMATWIQYQFAARWWIQARYEELGLPHPASIPSEKKQSALIGFYPSEFSGFRFQYDHLKTQGVADDDHTFSLQYNISIGAHPAHAY